MSRPKYKQMYLAAQANVATLTIAANEANDALGHLSTYGKQVMDRLMIETPGQVTPMRHVGQSFVSEGESVCYRIPRHEWEALRVYMRATSTPSSNGGFVNLSVGGYPVVWS